MSTVYRRRLALEWRAAVAVAVLAVAGVLLAHLPAPIDNVWPLGVFAATLLVAVVTIVAAVRHPLGPPSEMPKQVDHHDVAAADRRVRRGQPVDPPGLQTAAIDQVRRSLRIGHLTLGWWPALGGTWALRINEPGFFGGFGYVGLALMLLGISGLAWSRVTQRRLDRLEQASATTDDQPPHA